MIVFESDDWGLERRRSSERLKAFGVPAQAADEELETVEDLRRLSDVLSRYSDAAGRSAVLTANVVVANPDFDAIAQGRYDVYREIPISTREDLCAAWRRGVERGVFCGELHGRRHFSIEAWLTDLRSDVFGARELSSEHRHGGLSLLRGQNNRYHTEYVSWNAGVEPDENTLGAELEGSLDILQGVFGRRPTSTIAPHYTFSPRIEAAWLKAGLRFVQGANYQLLRGRDGGVSVSHALGERSPGGLLYLHRFVRFEPRPERSHQGISAAIDAIRFCFEQNLPAVVDTHRINYTGIFRERGLRDLGSLLDALMPLRPVFLTTAELGEAIERGGAYRDIFTGVERSLTALDAAWRQTVRQTVGWRNARRVASSRGDGRPVRGRVS